MKTDLVNDQKSIPKILEELNKIVYGKSRETRLALTCLLARGHLLIEDHPGMGKSTLVKALSKIIGLDTQRVQFTNDLLPADIIGSSIFLPETNKFEFHKGPLFTQLFFADELNRASPKTQSACLQAMEEHEVSVDGKTYPLPQPFFVVATQNPNDSIGTYPLPESQLDRFLMKIELGYPNREAEKKLLLNPKDHSALQKIHQVMNVDEFVKLQNQAQEIHVSENLVEYVQDLVDETRTQKGRGVSPRGSLALIRAARAWALLEGREFVVPEDVKSVAPHVLGHRITLENQGENFVAQSHFIERLLEQVPIRE